MSYFADAGAQDATALEWTWAAAEVEIKQFDDLSKVMRDQGKVKGSGAGAFIKKYSKSYTSNHLRRWRKWLEMAKGAGAVV